MKISYEKLLAQAETTGFRADVLEALGSSHPFLKGKLVLKGGTALNLFVLIAAKPKLFKPEEWRVTSKGWIWELHTVCSQMVQSSHHHTEPHRL